MKLFATRHSHAELYVHLVWSTKERVGVLNRDLRVGLSDQAVSTSRKFGATVLAFGGTPDHLHALLRYRPDLSVSDLVRKLKSALTRVIRCDVEELPDFEWQNGYGAFSVGPSEIDRIVTYVSNQEQHHATGDVRPEVDFED